MKLHYNKHKFIEVEEVMQISSVPTGDGIDIVVKDNIKTPEDSKLIKSAILLANEKGNKNIKIIIEDSFIITSSVIGFIVKSIKIDKMNIALAVKSDDLYEMLKEMNLIDEIGRAS
ncbi:MAG: hypothetical protein PHW07_09395, partial [Sulfurospirillaceae bacterium]|nr:hypothetical protein [Sulfurospirillaceae bacterium]